MLPSLLREIAVLETLKPTSEGADGIHEAFQAVADSAARLLNADRVSLILFDWEAKRIQHFLRGGEGWSKIMATMGFEELLSGLSGWALQTGEVALSPPNPPDPRESPEAQRRRQETHCGSILVAPLGAEGQRLGTLTAIQSEDLPDFVADDAETFDLFSQFAAQRIQILQSKGQIEHALAAAEAANRTKTNFLSNLSHELRTPLNGILGFSHLLEVSSLNASQLSMVQTIAESGQRLLATVDNLLELAQFESGKFRLENTAFSPKSVLVSILAKNQPLAKEKGLSWTVEIDPVLPSVLQGDPVRLGLAWNHILSNAVKFTSVGSVSVHLESKSLFAGRFELVLTVEDTGNGIVTDQQGTGFVPFRQEDGSLTRKFGGTGLGLALCDRIVSQMGGSLELWGRPGVGTRVRVRVELDEEGKTARSLSGLRVLLQESDPVGRLVLVGLFEKDGHLVDIAATAEEAEERLETSAYEVLLIEIPSGELEPWLPLAKKASQKGVAVIGLFSLGAEASEGFQWDGTLTKPVGYLSLQEVLNHCFSRKRP